MSALIGISKALALSVALGAIAPARAQFGFVVDPPDFNPSSTNGAVTFNTKQQVTLTCSSRLYTIYYTTDGNDPNLFSDKGPSPVKFEITHTTEVRAYCSYVNSTSAIVSQVYQLQTVPAPTANPATGYYNPEANGKLAVKLTGESGSTLHYTLDGSVPTEKSPSVTPGGTVQVTPTQTLKAIAVKPGWQNSSVLSETYYLKQTVAKPVATPGAGTFSGNLSITLSSSPKDAAIYYTLNGKDPRLATSTGATDTSIKLYGKAFSLPLATTTLRAVATSPNMNSSEVLEAKYEYLPPAPVVRITPASGTYADSVAVTLAMETADISGLEIRYTLDGKEPSASSQLYQKPFVLYAPTRLKVRSFSAATPPLAAPGKLDSADYKLSLSQPIADKYLNGGYYRYRDSLVVKVTSANPKAQILYTLNGTPPTNQSAILLNPLIRLGDKDTTEIRAMAILQDAAIQSPVSIWKYIKDPTPRLIPPQVVPGGQQFSDSLNVFLTSQDTGVFLHYTGDGSEPVQGSSPKGMPGKMITIKSSMTLKVKAFRDGSTPSETSTEIYYLIPASPVASLNSGVVDAGSKVTLRSSTPNVTILYSIDGDGWDKQKALDYGENDTLIVTQSMTLRAVAYLGSGSTLRESSVSTYQYIVNSKSDEGWITHDTVPVGTYKLVLATATSPNVKYIYNALPPQIPKLHLIRPIQLEAATPGGKIDVAITNAENQVYALYELIDGQARFVTSQFPAVVKQPGLYVFGTDSTAPQIQLLSHTVNGDDSAEVQLEIRDNILNPFYQVQSSGKPQWSEITRLSGPVDTVILRIKNAPGSTDDLWFRMRAGDFRQTTVFPTDSSRSFILPQAFTSLMLPNRLRLGETSYRWDLVGFPFSEKTPVTTDQLAKDNAGMQFKAFRFNALGSNEPITGDYPMFQGQGYWLAADKPAQSLKITRVKTSASDSDGVFRLRLHTGWNLIANPSLRTLYWPSSRQASNFGDQAVRGLLGYSHTLGNYAPSDSLEPFRGYYVYYRLTKDTLLALLKSPPAIALAKASASAENTRGWSLSLSEKTGSGLSQVPVLLGAFDGAQDALGREDEPSLLPPDGKEIPLHALRQGQALMSDFVARDAEGIKQFRLAYGQAGSGRPVPEISVSRLDLPQGYQAWAWLPDRQLKQPLTGGSRLNWWTTSSDSLFIVIGPSQTLEEWSHLAKARLEPGARLARLDLVRGMSRLRLELPAEQKLRIEWLQATGRLRVLLPPTSLGAGSHQFDWPRMKSGLIRIRASDAKTGEAWSQILRP